MSTRIIEHQRRWLRRIVCAVCALALPAAAIATSPSAFAQAMPNSGAWLNSMIARQMMLNYQGNLAAQRLYYLCITHPGACRPAPGALNQANQALQNQNMRNFQSMRNNYNSIYRTNRNFDRRVIQQRCWWQYRSNGTRYWRC